MQKISRIILMLFATYTYSTAQYQRDWDIIWDWHNASWPTQVASATMADGGIATLANLIANMKQFMIIRRISANGEEIWADTVQAQLELTGIDLICTVDNHIAVTAREEDGFGTYNFRTLLYDDSRNVLWDHYYDSGGGNSDEPVKLTCDSKGNIYVTGLSGSDLAIVFYSVEDSSDTWVSVYDGPGNSTDLPRTIVTNPDGSGYVIGDLSIGPNEYAGGVVHFKNDGRIAWWDTTDFRFLEESKYCGLTEDDASLIVFGNSPQGYSIVRFDSTKHRLDRLDYETTSIRWNNSPRQILKRNNGQFIALGESFDHNKQRYYVDLFSVFEDLTRDWAVKDSIDDIAVLNRYPVMTLSGDDFVYLAGEASDIYIKSIDPDGNVAIILQDTLSGYSRYTIRHIQLNADNSLLLDGNISDQISMFNLFTVLYKTPAAIEVSASHLPTGFQLYQNYPNPFNPKTVIRYALPVTSQLDLSIYNTLGQKVVTLVNKNQTHGKYEVKWDASDFSSGVYFYRIQAGDLVQTRRMLLIK